MNIRNGFTARNFAVAFLAFFIFADNVFSQNLITESDLIRVNTDLIQTNITVLDKNRRFVDGLKAEQFELRVDGKSVPINFFDRVVSARANENLQNQTNPQTSNVAVGNPSLLRERKVIFLVDDLYLSFDRTAVEQTVITIE